MDPFWNNIYDDVKDRRYGTLFLCTLFFGLPLLVLALVAASEIFAYLMDVITDVGPFDVVCLVLLASAALMAMALFWRHWIRIGRKARQDRSIYSNLSRDELFKPRLKLKSKMKPVKFRLVERPQKRVASPRAPDIDLKY